MYPQQIYQIVAIMTHVGSLEEYTPLNSFNKLVKASFFLYCPFRRIIQTLCLGKYNKDLKTNKLHDG